MFYINIELLDSIFVFTRNRKKHRLSCLVGQQRLINTSFMLIHKDWLLVLMLLFSLPPESQTGIIIPLVTFHRQCAQVPTCCTSDLFSSFRGRGTFLLQAVWTGRTVLIHWVELLDASLGPGFLSQSVCG